MFLGVTASVTNWNGEGTECSLVGWPLQVDRCAHWVFTTPRQEAQGA